MPFVTLVPFDRPFVADRTVPVRRASAFAWIKHGLSLTELTERHLIDMLRFGIWKWTGAAGVNPYYKYNHRYVSEGVLHPSSPTAKINHEHVWTQKYLIKKLRSRRWADEDLRAFLEEFAVACVVTVDEHALLSGQSVEGWERYVQSGVRVWDRAEQQWADLGAPAPAVESAAIPPTVTSRHHGVPVSAEVESHILERATPELAALLLDFIATARTTGAVETPSYKKTGESSRYFRVHDAVIGEPTAAVAYPHWNGRVTYRLQLDDLPGTLRDDPRVGPRKHKTYGVQLKITDSASLRVASEVLVAALEKLRDPYEM